jgi:hypothetical protein
MTVLCYIMQDISENVCVLHCRNDVPVTCQHNIVLSRVVDPDRIQIQTLWIRIRIWNPDPGPGARKLRNFSGKMH